MWNGLKNCLREVAEEVCGKTKAPPIHEETRWWNKKVEAVVDDKRNLFAAWHKIKKVEDIEKETITAAWNLYCAAKRAAKKEITKAQEVERKKFCERFEKEDGRNNV